MQVRRMQVRRVAALSRTVPVTQRHAGDRHHLKADLQSSPSDMLVLTRERPNRTVCMLVSFFFQGEPGETARQSPGRGGDAISCKPRGTVAWSLSRTRP
jgi:hypothetical protein